MLLLGIFYESQDSVMQITPTELSSAICCISSTFLVNDLTLADNIIGIYRIWDLNALVGCVERQS